MLFGTQDLPCSQIMMNLHQKYCFQDPSLPQHPEDWNPNNLPDGKIMALREEFKIEWERRCAIIIITVVAVAVTFVIFLLVPTPPMLVAPCNKSILLKTFTHSNPLIQLERKECTEMNNTPSDNNCSVRISHYNNIIRLTQSHHARCTHQRCANKFRHVGEAQRLIHQLDAY